MEILSRNSATAILIVEQKVRVLCTIANRASVLRNGRVSFTATDAKRF